MGKNKKLGKTSPTFRIGSEGMGISKHRTSGHSGPNKLTRVLQANEINAEHDLTQKLASRKKEPMFGSIAELMKNNR
jgi:hypothetical protein